MADDETKTEVGENKDTEATPNKEDGEVSEKEAIQADEKDKDTAEDTARSEKSAKSRKSIADSKPSSAKSAGSGGAKSGKGSAKSGKKSPGPKSPRQKSPKGKSSAKSKKSTSAVSKKEEEALEPKPSDAGGIPAPIFAEDGELPEGVVPIFLASKTQELFAVVCDEDVTAESPWKLVKKQDILDDLYNRAAVCDFSVFKQEINDYPEDEILLGYDADFKFGQNFFIALSAEAKEKLLHPEPVLGEDGEPISGEPEEQVVYKYVPPTPKDWEHLGSSKEIDEEALRENRPRMKLSAKRIRREFGAPIFFSDRNVAQAKDSYVECLPYEDRTFDLKRIELDKGTQAISETAHVAAQTDWKYPRNACVQYEPREFSQDEKDELLKTEELIEGAELTVPRFKLALQQNEIMDVFYDDWTNLGDDDSSFGSKADNHLKEYQSFTDLQFSKNKTVTCIDWFPTIKGVVAVSVGERLSFDDRLDMAHRVIMTPSLILVWSFADPIHPQLLLEAPDDIMSFKFCPTNPNYIVGGCINGQVVLWDITAHAERLKQPRGGKKKAANLLPGFDDESSETPVIRYCAVSSIEHSHRAPVTDVLWMPDHMELNRMGVPHENKSGECVQILTCATDHTVLVWDIRPPKIQTHEQKKKDEIKNPMGVPTTFKHLDLVWKPHLKISLSKSEPGGDHAPTRFSIQEKQGDKSTLGPSEDTKAPKPPATDTATGGYSMGMTKPGSAKRALSHMNTKFYVGTEDGEIVYLDWMPQKDQDTGKIQTPKPDFYHTYHDGPVVTLQRSPFFKDILLCVGGWSFSIWKEGVKSGPILSSCASNKRLTAGHWSPTRPAVFYITRQDGSVDIWDILDRTHEPSMNQSVSPSPITSVYPIQVTNKQHLLAIGDHSGTLHILEIPWSLRTPTMNELQGVGFYFDREVKRRGFVMARWDFREKEKIEMEIEKKNKAGIAPNVILTDEEIEYRQKQEYQAYLDEEANFLRELGLKDEVEEPLPSVE